MKSKIKCIPLLSMMILSITVTTMTGCGEKKQEPEIKEVKKEETLKEETVEEKILEPVITECENFAIFGVDTRANNLDRGTRSDSIMIVSVDHETKQIRIASILRDCYMRIEGYGYEKITHAHSYGGPELGLQTLNTNLDLNLEKYLTVNFIKAADLVDDIGGIEMEITAEETQYINSYIDELNSIRGSKSVHIAEAGTYNLDGTQAVSYSRIRYTDGGDFKRSERQREILFKMFSKVKEMDTEDAAALVSEMIEEINTNYQTEEVVELLYHLSEYEIVGMTVYPQVFYSGNLNGVYVEAADTMEDMAVSIHNFLYPESEYIPSNTVKEISGQITSDINAYGAGMGRVTLESQEE